MKKKIFSNNMSWDAHGTSPLFQNRPDDVVRRMGPKKNRRVMVRWEEGGGGGERDGMLLAVAAMLAAPCAAVMIGACVEWWFEEEEVVVSDGEEDEMGMQGEEMDTKEGQGAEGVVVDLDGEEDVI